MIETDDQWLWYDGTPQTCGDVHNHPLLDLQSELHGGTKDKLKLSVVR